MLCQGNAGAQIVREKAYYVPFDDIEDVFNKTGKGIFLPYEKFLELWNKANPETTVGDDSPPTDAVLRAGTYVGTVRGDSVHFEVTYSIEALKKGWSEVRLLLSDVAVESAELSDDQALFSAVNGGYSVYLPRAGQYQLTLRFAVGIDKQPGKKSFRFRYSRGSRIEARSERFPSRRSGSMSPPASPSRKP